MSRQIALCGVNAYYTEYWDDTVLMEKGLGGTETWFIELSQEFAKNGYEVTLFCRPKERHIDEYGVKYVDISQCGGKYDIFISYSINDIEKVISNKYYIVPSCEYIDGIKEDSTIEKNTKIICISEWQKNEFLKIYPFLQEDKLLYIPLGTNMFHYFENVNIDEKENAMVWSSSYFRGLEFLIEKVFPLIKQRIPDFKLYLCSYSDNGINNKWLNKENEGIIFKKNLNKKDLALLQNKCKFWIYPNYGLLSDNTFFHETFCLTAVENALAGNLIICFGEKDGIQSTLNGYSGLINGKFFNEYGWFYNEDFTSMAFTIVAQVMRLYYHNEIQEQYKKELKNISHKYKWDNIIKMWIKEIEND